MSTVENDVILEARAESNLEELIGTFDRLACQVIEPQENSLAMALYLQDGLNAYITETLHKMGFAEASLALARKTNAQMRGL